MKAKPASINISLPVPLRQKPEQRVQRLGTYGSTSEYLRELIRRDLQRDAVDQIDKLLMDGVSSGPAEPTDAAWRKARRAALRKAQRRRNPSRA